MKKYKLVLTEEVLKEQQEYNYFAVPVEDEDGIDPTDLIDCPRCGGLGEEPSVTGEDTIDPYDCRLCNGEGMITVAHYDKVKNYYEGNFFKGEERGINAEI